MTSDKILQLLLGLLGAVFLGFQGWLATSLIDGQSDTNDRLIKIETTISENREERQQQIVDLRTRIQRLEERSDRR